MIERLDRNEVLRYLGYKQTGMTERIEKVLNRAEQETLEIIKPKYIYKKYKIEKTARGILVPDTQLCLQGKDIEAHLNNCKEIYLMAVTIGIEMDRRIRRYMASEPDLGIILDSCGIQAVEQIADLAEKEIEQEVCQLGYHLTWRFSPGYGDLPLECQKALIHELDAPRKIGLTLTDSCLMVPGKSVTAIIGVSDTRKDKRENKCDFCNNRTHCEFRRNGIRC